MMRFMLGWMWFSQGDRVAPIASRLTPTLECISNVGVSLLAMASSQPPYQSSSRYILLRPTTGRNHLHTHSRHRQVHPGLIQMPLQRQIERP